MTKAICYDTETGELFASGESAWPYYKRWKKDRSSPLAFSENMEDEGFDYGRLLVEPEYRRELSRHFPSRT